MSIDPLENILLGWPLISSSLVFSIEHETLFYEYTIKVMASRILYAKYIGLNLILWHKFISRNSWQTIILLLHKHRIWLLQSDISFTFIAMLSPFRPHKMPGNEINHIQNSFTSCIFYLVHYYILQIYLTV